MSENESKFVVEEVEAVAEVAVPGAGSCGGMYTANTMASAIEALGMSLANSSAQEAVFDSSCVQPFIDHPSDDAVRHSLVEERPEMRVRNRIKILLYVEINHPVEPLCPQHVLHIAQRLMSRAARSEAI